MKFLIQSKIKFLILISLGAHLFFYFFLYSQRHNYLTLQQGDFPAFYTAAVMSGQHLGGELYSATTQCEVQKSFYPDIDLQSGGCLYFAYPPYFVFWLKPLIAFTPYSAKIIFDGAMLVMSLLALIGLLQGRNRADQGEQFRLMTGLLLSCYPVTMGILGGQTVALSMVLYVFVLNIFRRENSKLDWIAGIILGLWAFKPHYPAFLILLLFAYRMWKVIAVFMACMFVNYALGIWITGNRLWMMNWIHTIHWYSQDDLIYNAYQMISIPAIVFKCLSYFVSRESALNIYQISNGIVALIFIVGVIAVGYRNWNKDFQTRRENIVKSFQLAGPLVLMLSPHSLFYDFGIVFIAGLSCVDWKNDKHLQWFLIGILAVNLLCNYRVERGIIPLAFAMPFFAVWLYRRIYKSI